MMYAPAHYTSKICHSKNGQEIIKGTRKKQTEIKEVALETQQSEDVANKGPDN